ncbi:tetratricopeptide repeat protein [Streptomyces cyaneofuscatus]|uniref:tetratricopeptide repeat protein n=1 Tax=Streptomyces cyaneofuscatus TaxID=66883 RepID=UPI0036498FA1
MTGSGGHDIRNEVSGGLFFNAVVQGHHITLQLPTSLTPALTGMPSPSPAFTGRNSETDMLLESLGSNPEAGGPNQLIAGLPGVGKTELALQVAHRALRTPGLLTGGVLFIDLFGYDDARRVGPHKALGSLLRALAVPGEYIPEETEDRARLYRSVLAAYEANQRRILLVLDNAMSSAQVRPLLPGGGSVPVLITSRHTLTDLKARLLDLSVLGPQAAVELIDRSLNEVVGPTDKRVAKEPEAAGEIASLCGRLPLALSIVSALLADTPTRPLHSMAAALRDARSRLERLSREDLAVRVAFDLSYHHLKPDQAGMFRLLPLNPGPDVSTEAAAQLMGTSAHAAEALLLLLARGHFVEPGSSYGRWRMHDLIRLYAEDLSRTQDLPEDREAATDRLLKHYVIAASAADTHVDVGNVPSPLFSDRDSAFGWLDAERHNLVAAALAAPEWGRPGVLLLLHYALTDFQSQRRHFDECAELALATLTTIRSSDEPALREAEASVLNNLATVQRELRRFDAAVATYHESLQLQERDDHLADITATLCNLGLTYQQMGRPEEAVNVLRRAMTLSPSEPSRVRGMICNNLGKALHDLRRWPEAVEVYHEDIAICRSVGDRRGEGVTLNNLGMVLRDMGKPDEAVEVFESALEAAKETKDLYSESLAEANLGWALAASLSERGPQEAIDRLTRAIVTLESLGDEHMASLGRNQLAMVLLQAGSPGRAIDPLMSVLEMSRKFGDSQTRAMALTNLGTALELSGRYPEAVQAQRDAVGLYRELGERHREGQALLNLGLAIRRTGNLKAAIEAFDASATALRETEDDSSCTQALSIKNETAILRRRRLRRWLTRSHRGARRP